MSGRDTVERRRAFTGLLAHPVIDRHANPELLALVRRHRPVLITWFAEYLGYRLVVTDTAARLFRLPLGGAVLAPPRFGQPPRRVLVLAVLAAAAAEDTEDVTTTQDLSDRVRALSGHEDVHLAPYEPDRFSERQLFAKAVQVLLGAGALRPTGKGADEQREGWARRTDAVGGAYDVQRELLLRMVEPSALDAALGTPDSEAAPEDSSARFGIMRRLLELPVCLHADLTDAERTYLASQRYRILAWCEEMTGWVVEQRAEGLALIAAEEGDTDLPFPRLRAVDFVALMLLDELLRKQSNAGLVTAADLDQAAAEVRRGHEKAMTKELADDQALRAKGMETLLALDLLRPAAGKDTWWLTPAAARFRNPRVVSVTTRIDDGDDVDDERTDEEYQP
ncbi:MAG: TIGR02678 family protein [Sciscionella sp.]